MAAQELPHHYSVSATSQNEGDIVLSSTGLPTICSAPPSQFGGPGDKWSPEDLLVAAVVDCFILTFRAVARASKVEWVNLECTAQGKLERIDRVTQFTAFEITAKLTIAADTDREKAAKILEKSEASCLITNSLKADCHLKSEIVIQ